TTHGGTVLEGMMEWDIEGVPVACVGHKVSCPQCKGTYPIVEGASNTTVMGKPVALEGMQTACGAQLISSQTLSSVDDDSWQGFRLQAKSFTSSVNHQALGMKDVSTNHYTSTAPIFIKNNDEQYECAHQDGAIDVAKYIVNEIQTNAKSPMAKM